LPQEGTVARLVDAMAGADAAAAANVADAVLELPRRLAQRDQGPSRL
jgi:hypothetical protein